MRVCKCLLLTVLTVILTTATCWGDSVITGFQGNGEVTVTGLWTNARYHVEWASSLDGPWYRSWQPCYDEESGSNTTVTIKVPMFYRVVMSSNAPPAGMVLVDAGSYQMGDNYDEGNVDERPVHEVHVSAFYMDRYEVSKALWDEVRTWATNQGYSIANGAAAGTNHPVQTVNWYDVVKWCNARSEKEGLTPVYYTSSAKTTVYTNGSVNVSNDWVRWEADGYRLPTEAEWEKAARGGLRGHHYPWDSRGGAWGAHIDGSKANYSGSGDPYDNATTPVGYYNGSQTPVGSDTANGYGLYDMAGNVWEWCWDWYQSDWYSQPGATQDDTRGPTGPLSDRVLRGGSWGSSTGYLLCAVRGSGVTPGFSFNGGGFRCARGL